MLLLDSPQVWLRASLKTAYNIMSNKMKGILPSAGVGKPLTRLPTPGIAQGGSLGGLLEA